MFAGRFSVSDRQRADERRSNVFARTSAGRSWLVGWSGEGSCVRQNRVVLAPVAGVKSAEVFASPTGSRKTVNSPMTEARGIRLRGELGISRQTIAQGRPDALRWTCMLVCALLCAHCTRDRGCSAHPVFPAPSLGESFGQASGASRREIANAYSVVIARLAASAKAPASQRGKASAKPWRSRDRATQYSRDGSD
jgi:hypothetical protein